MMKKRLLYFFLTISFLGCSDGDLQVENIDFDPVAVQFCTGNNTIFFKIIDSEAIILVLPNDMIVNEVTGDEPRTSAIPTASRFFYRFFTDNVTANYFCGDIPPATPLVDNELEATAGTVTVTTTSETSEIEGEEEETVTYTHSIQINGLVLLNTNGERIISSSFTFGEVTSTN